MFAVPLLNRARRLSMAAGLAAAMLLLVGCATAPMAPPAALNQAQIAIKDAEKDDARQYAGAELDEARQKLMLADKAVAAENMVLAERYAHEENGVEPN